VKARLRLAAALSVAVTCTGVPRLGVLARCPDHRSVTRSPLPSARPSRYEFPGVAGTMRDSDSCHPVSPDSCARPAIPPLHREASLLPDPGAVGEAWSFGVRQLRGPI